MLMISVFVIVVMSAWVITLTRLLSTSQDAVVYEVLGVRALNAARSGLEQAVREVFPTQDSDASACNDVGKNQDYSTIPGMLGCSAVYACTVSKIKGVDYFRFESRGQCISGDWIVSRTVSIDGKDY